MKQEPTHQIFPPLSIRRWVAHSANACCRNLVVGTIIFWLTPILIVAGGVFIGPNISHAASDGDNDLVPDTEDRCPGTPFGVPVDRSGCPIGGSPGGDDDKDGVSKERDRCPNTPDGVSVDSNGCPRTGESIDTVVGGVEDVALLENSLPNVAVGGGLGGYLQGLLFLGIGVATVLAVVMLTIGGVQYMISSSMGNKEAGKEKISDAIWGLVLALGSFLILNTINPNLVNVDISSTIQDIGEDIRKKREEARENVGGVAVPPAERKPWPSDEKEVAKLIEETRNPDTGVPRVKVKSTGGDISCTYIKETGCTSLAGINDRFFTGMKELVEKNPNCIIEVNAGTEYWLHTGGLKFIPDEIRLDEERNPTEHKRGNSVVDLNDGCIDKYIMAAVPHTNDPRELSCHHRIDHPDGNLYRWDNGRCTSASSGAHWHVTFR